MNKYTVNVPDDEFEENDNPLGLRARRGERRRTLERKG